MARLTLQMVAALHRLAQAYVYADVRSCRALVRRGLARPLGDFSDAMLGDFTSFAITTEGKAYLAAQPLKTNEVKS